MDAGSTFALFAVAGAVIGLAISASQMFQRFVAYKEAKLAALAANSAEHEERRAMAARLEVLERIVTDRGYDVANQIEALRDTPLQIAEKERA